MLLVRILGARVPDRFGAIRTTTLALLAVAAGMAVITVVDVPAAIFAGTFVFSVGMSLLFPALFSLVVNTAPARERSHAVGTFSLFFDLSQGAGAPLLGVVVDLTGTDRAAFAAAVVIALAGLVVARIRLPALVAGDGRARPGPAPTAPRVPSRSDRRGPHMESFAGKLAVVTGGGTGMGRELVVQLAAEGCSVASCDVHVDNLAETEGRALAGAPDGTRVSSHRADVSSEEDLQRFRDEAVEAHGADHVDLVFNNAGIGGGGSFVAGGRDEWERTFGVCWGGVYLGRPHLPAPAAGRARGAPGQHQQRQRVLGRPLAGRAPHRLQRGQVRGEGLLRGPHRGPPGQRPPRVGARGDARPHRHRHHAQQPPHPPG